MDYYIYTNEMRELTCHILLFCLTCLFIWNVQLLKHFLAFILFCELFLLAMNTAIAIYCATGNFLYWQFLIYLIIGLLGVEVAIAISFILNYFTLKRSTKIDILSELHK
jgi:NADH:ubiquinone oxidoreductase subunit K